MACILLYKCTTYIIVVMILKNVFVVDFGMHTYPCRLSTRSRYGSVCYVKKNVHLIPEHIQIIENEVLYLTDT